MAILPQQLYDWSANEKLVLLHDNEHEYMIMQQP